MINNAGVVGLQICISPGKDIFVLLEQTDKPIPFGRWTAFAEVHKLRIRLSPQVYQFELQGWAVRLYISGSSEFLIQVKHIL